MPRRPIAVFAIAVAALGCAVTGASAAPPGVPSTVQVATIIPNAPFAFRQGGKLTGFDVQLANAIAKVAGIRVLQWRPVQLSQLIAQTAAGITPMAASSLTITADRQKLVTFGTPYLDANLAIVTRRGNVVAQDGNLSNLTVAALKGSTAAQYIGGLPDVVDVTYPNMTQGYTALLRGTVDAVVNDHAQSAWYVSHNASRFLLAATINQPGKIAFAFNKNQDALRNAFNAGLATVKANGTYQRLINRWIP